MNLNLNLNLNLTKGCRRGASTSTANGCVCMQVSEAAFYFNPGLHGQSVHMQYAVNNELPDWAQVVYLPSCCAIYITTLLLLL